MTHASAPPVNLTPWRVAMWGGAAVLLALRAVAMRFTDEVRWDAEDFVTIGAMLLVACVTCEVAARISRNPAYLAGTALAVAAGFALIFINLAVGIIGNEGNPANLMYAGVLLVGLVGAVLARLQARGMAHALLATAAAHALTAVIALLADWGNTVPITLVFVALWLCASMLFRRAARALPASR